MQFFNFNSKTTLAVAIVTCFAICASNSATVKAQATTEKQAPNVQESAEKSPSAGAVDQAALAIKLVMIGEKRKSPMMLLAAAEILGDLRQSSKEIPTAEKQSEGSSDKQDKSAPAISYKGLLRRAMELAKDNETLFPLVKARVDALRGGKGITYEDGDDMESVKVGGKTYKIIDHDVISAGESFRYRSYDFEGQKPAKVIIIGDGDGDIDLWVYDKNTGGLIGKDTDASSNCIVEWTPRYEGPFTIRIKNVGDIAERYVVLANW